ncbi:MAG: zf-HC2 domain-containing protein [Dehalococcoidia bacterium]
MAKLIRMFRRKSNDLDCDEVQDLASDYVDKELEEPVLAKVRRHLSFCPPCQSFMDSFGKTVRLLRSMPKEKAPDAVRQRIIEQTRKD